MTTAIFLRHGLTVENREDRLQGQQPGSLLVPEAERFLAGVVPLLREKKINVLISSDLDRAIDTRDILHTFLQLPYVQVDESKLLREISAGVFEGMLWPEAPAHLKQQRQHGGLDFRSGGGENEADVRERVKAFLKLISGQYLNQRLCCVTHAEWMGQLVAVAGHAGDLPKQWVDRLVITECGIADSGTITYLEPISIRAYVDLPDQVKPAKTVSPLTAP